VRLKWPALGGGAFLASGATYLSIPLFLGLGASAACGCAARLADTSMEWSKCAIRTAVANKEEARFKFILEQGVTRDGPEPWAGQNAAYDQFLAGPVQRDCGSFIEARNEDQRIAKLRADWGYEELYIPEKSSDAIHSANDEAGKGSAYMIEVIREMRGPNA
jgi:hypothetical protein